MQCFVFSFDEKVVDIMSLFGFAHPDITALVDWAQNTNLLAYLLSVWFCLSLHTLAVVHFRVFPTCQLVTGGGKRKPAAVSVQHPFLYQAPSDLPRSKPLVRAALPASLSAGSFSFTPACPYGQSKQRRHATAADRAICRNKTFKKKNLAWWWHWALPVHTVLEIAT